MTQFDLKMDNLNTIGLNGIERDYYYLCFILKNVPRMTNNRTEFYLKIGTRRGGQLFFSHTTKFDDDCNESSVQITVIFTRTSVENKRRTARFTFIDEKPI